MDKSHTSTLTFKSLLYLLPILFLAPTAVSGQESQEPKEESKEEVKILDNSFLVEEAYNQEQGVLQNIFNWVPSWERGVGGNRTFDFLFTQEWPVFSQKHQLSYSIPLSSIDETPRGGPASHAQGLGDIFLNYRYQVWNDEQGDPFAFAPRFSLIFPSGDADAGLGLGKMGYQINLPFSKQYEKCAWNFNAGLTKTPGVTAGVDPLLLSEGHTIDGYNLGASFIYFLRPNFHLMLESVALWNEELSFEGHEDARHEIIVSPGFRWAAYTKGDTQWVLGLGLPIGVTPDAPDIGVIFYMSFESRIVKKRGESDTESKPTRLFRF